MAGIIYFEHDKKIGHKLHIDGERHVLCGTAHRVNGDSKELIAVTPGYKPSAEDTKMWARSDSTPRQRVLLRGTLTRVQSTQATAAKVDQTAVSQREPAQVPAHDRSRQRKKQLMSPEKFSSVLSSVMQQQNAGIRATVPVAFACVYLNESRATIFRRIKRGELGDPIKRGGRTYLLFTALETFRTTGASQAQPSK